MRTGRGGQAFLGTHKIKGFPSNLSLPSGLSQTATEEKFETYDLFLRYVFYDMFLLNDFGEPFNMWDGFSRRGLASAGSSENNSEIKSLWTSLCPNLISSLFPIIV